ncbi:hypothetical protein GQ42DRAFT_25824 [Ramicandelaber brevisporus]|nr:hypothetical protein GQ42DRAFT_25824 [Ramicandelaber brevisporus]
MLFLSYLAIHLSAYYRFVLFSLYGFLLLSSCYFRPTVTSFLLPLPTSCGFLLATLPHPHRPLVQTTGSPPSQHEYACHCCSPADCLQVPSLLST